MPLRSLAMSLLYSCNKLSDSIASIIEKVMHTFLQQSESPEIYSFLKFLDLCGKKVSNCPIGERTIVIQERLNIRK